MAILDTCQWIRSHQNVILTGATTGYSKSWIACLQAFSVYYVPAPRFYESSTLAHGDFTYVKRLQAIAKTDLITIDDWGLDPLTQRDSTDLLEILDNRVGSRSTIITSQLPPDHWHAWIKDPTLGDAILDRVLNTASPSLANHLVAERPQPEKKKIFYDTHIKSS